MLRYVENRRSAAVGDRLQFVELRKPRKEETLRSAACGELADSQLAASFALRSRRLYLAEVLAA